MKQIQGREIKVRCQVSERLESYGAQRYLFQGDVNAIH